VQPRTSYFDPGPSLGVMERYGMSAQARSSAEENLKSRRDIAVAADQIDQAENFNPQNRRNVLRVQDREDLAHEEKKEFENTLGTFLVDFAKLDESADDFDERVATLIADPRALNNDAVRSMYNLKVQQRGENIRMRESDDNRNQAIIESWASAGFLPGEITDETGRFDPSKAGLAKRSAFTGNANAKARQDQYKGDPDIANATTAEEVAPFLATRLSVFNESAKDQITLAPDSEEFKQLLLDAPNLTSDAFVARLINFDAGGVDLDGITDKTERYIRLLGRGGSSTDPALRPMAKAALGLFHAAHAAGSLPRRATPAPEVGEPTAPDSDAQDYLKRQQARRSADTAPLPVTPSP
jgi:hypothetical protein